MGKKLIYIIGNSSKHITEDEIEKYRIAELILISVGFKVHNPLAVSKNGEKVISESNKVKNIQQLFNCDAIYILPCATINENNLELRIAMLLDLLVIHGVDK